MNQMNKLRWAIIAASLLSGPALAATIDCDVTPRNSVIADGQTLQLAATCTGGTLSSIDLLMGNTTFTSVSGAVSLAGHAEGDPITFTTPINSAAIGANEIKFKVNATPASGNDSFGVSSVAHVVIKSAGSAVSAPAAGFASSGTPVDAACGTANNQTVQNLPTNGQLCTSGSKPALVVSGPTSYSWSCLSVTGGAEANCYATRGVTVTVTTSSSGGSGGSISPSQQVASGSQVIVTATPPSGWNTGWSGTCNGTPNVNTFTINAVTQSCTVIATFTSAPAPVNGSCGSSNGQMFTTAPTTNLCSYTAASQTIVTTNPSTYTWNCTGLNNGSTANCSATRDTPPSPGGDPGSGFWWVDANRMIADQTGTGSDKLDYVPGCLNSESTTNGSTGCALINTNDGFKFGPGKVLGLRFTSKSPLSSSVKFFKIYNNFGSGVPPTLKAWLSDDPTSTYEGVSSGCKGFVSTVGYVATGPGYCGISPNKKYYLFIRDDSGTEGSRFIVDEANADLY